jgi:D-alanyl-D-alanine carboxypeptidase
MSKNRRIFIALVVLVAAIAVSMFVLDMRADAPSSGSNSQSQQESTGFDKKMNSIYEPGSPWWIVNKDRPLPDGYVPELGVPDVRLRLARDAEQMKFGTLAMKSLEEMFAAAQANGVELVFGSGYRSYALQKQFYDSYVAQDGQEAADRYSARPGTSEHQTGLAFDATAMSGQCHLEICFEDMPEGQWLLENAHKYGFIIRYPKGKEHITTYQYEPWHLRYVGKELATELRHIGQAMEEFFALVD